MKTGMHFSARSQDNLINIRYSKIFFGLKF
jgi:hypothetical protein